MSDRSRQVWRALPFFVARTAAGCGGSTYGHAPSYVPLDAERTAAAAAHPFDPGAALHKSDVGQSVSLFGVVESRSAGTGGQALLRLSIRSLEGSNVCKRAGDDDTCRVTVGDKDEGVVWALVALRAEDDVGGHAIGQRTLVRVIGTIGQDVSPTDGAPIVHGAFYRQWPVGEYVTPSTASSMR